MRPRTFPVSNVGSGKAACGRSNKGFDASVGSGSDEQIARHREARDHARWEELKVEVRALLDGREPLPAGFDRKTVEDLLRADHIEAQTEEMLRRWMTARAAVRLGISEPRGRSQP